MFSMELCNELIEHNYNHQVAVSCMPSNSCCYLMNAMNTSAIPRCTHNSNSFKTEQINIIMKYTTTQYTSLNDTSVIALQQSQHQWPPHNCCLSVKSTRIHHYPSVLTSCSWSTSNLDRPSCHNQLPVPSGRDPPPCCLGDGVQDVRTSHTIDNLLIVMVTSWANHN